MMSNSSQSPLTYLDALLDKDKWRAEEIGLDPDPTHSSYYLNFSKIKQSWLKRATKRFVRYQAATKTFNTCRSYIASLAHFSRFIECRSPNLQPQSVCRSSIIDFVNYLSIQQLGSTTRSIAMVNLRTFLEICCREEWIPLTPKHLIYSEDIPKHRVPKPDFIPETVITQLMQHLSKLPKEIQRLIYILQETGRRISEICTLPYDCIEKDTNGGNFLKVNDRKLKKFYLIPTTKECADTIECQQNYMMENEAEKSGYLFKPLGGSKSEHITARYINMILNKLAKQENIVGDSGEIWHFHTHQFRHTVGTRMINAGVPQPIVQRYLGHESPEMTARYAYIHDRTLKNAFDKFQGTLVDIQGEVHLTEDQASNEAQWLKHNIMAQALPNGVCALPAAQQRCPHANACLTCFHFRTDDRFLEQHEKQLSETKKNIMEAKKHGWKRQAEMNKEVKISLEKVINTLRKGKNHDP
jgi:integrase/recombinase XerD